MFAVSKDYGKSLVFAELLIEYHPNDWNGYARAAKDLSALNRINKKRRLEKLRRVYGDFQVKLISS